MMLAWHGLELMGPEMNNRGIMRFRSVFYYVDFLDDRRSCLSIRSFSFSGKKTREWLSSNLETAKSIQEIRHRLYKRYKGKLRNIGIEFDPEVIAAFGVPKMELLDLA